MEGMELQYIQDIMIDILGWLGTTLILIAYYLNAKKYISSWILWCVGNLCMLIYGYYINSHPQVFLAFVLMILNIYGYFSWKKDRV